MNTITRIKMVKAMEYIVRHINAEDLIYDEWLTTGVSDGDVEYGDLSIKAEDPRDLEYYLRSKEFAALMDTFLDLMAQAKEDGGLYCDGVVSKDIDWSKEG